MPLVSNKTLYCISGDRPFLRPRLLLETGQDLFVAHVMVWVATQLLMKFEIVAMLLSIMCV